MVRGAFYKVGVHMLTTASSSPGSALRLQLVTASRCQYKNKRKARTCRR
jgi:hypothetical protein